MGILTLDFLIPITVQRGGGLRHHNAKGSFASCILRGCRTWMDSGPPSLVLHPPGPSSRVLHPQGPSSRVLHPSGPSSCVFASCVQSRTVAIPDPDPSRVATIGP